MTDYTKLVDYAEKDTLASGDPGKVIKGTELDNEFESIEDAIGTKADLASPEFTGTPTLATSPAYTVNNSQVATTQFVYDLIESGATGTNGTSIATLFIYKNASSLPADPSGGSFNFSTQALTAPTGWSQTIPTKASGEVIYISQTLASTNIVNGTDDTLSWTSPVVLAEDGEAGTSADTSSNSITVYYPNASASAPTLTSANFSDGDYVASTGALTLPSPWVQSFTTPTTVEGDKLWAATVNVYIADDGTQTFTVYGPFNWIRFDGLVTFTNLENKINTTTEINGGIITTDTIQLNRLTSSSDSFNNVTFGLGSGQSVAGYTAAGYFKANSSSKVGVMSLNDGGIGFAAASQADAAIFAGYGSSYTSFDAEAILAYSEYAGRFSDGTNWIELCNGTYAFETSGGNSGTFTGGHDALLPTNESIEVGDIVVDTEVVKKQNVFDVITKVAKSSEANQKAVVGVYAKDSADGHIPAVFRQYKKEEGGRSYYDMNSAYEYIYDTHKNINMNGIGEGLINVCGENGNIEIGDLIVTSSIAGKGMKQSDDLIRSYTVAKAREAVNFSSNTEVQQIACIYLCG